MKISRHKKLQRHLGFYVNNYKFRKPFQILIDGTFAFAALQNKFNIKEQLPKYLQGETKILTTQCMISEVEKLGSKLFGTLLIIKQFATHKCGHDKEPIAGIKCFQSMLKKDNPSRYIIATQDRELQEYIRQMACVPLLYLHGKAPTLDPPSQKSLDQAEKIRKGMLLTNQQEESLKELKKQSGIPTNDDLQPKKKKKKKGPNPLSCKKKQKKDNKETVNKTNDNGKVRKRKRIKIAKHVREIYKAEKASEKSG